MKLLHSAPNFAEISLLKSVLEQAGIPSLTRNENLSLASGAIPFLECTPELWVQEEDYSQAQALLSQWQNDIEKPPPT